VTGGRPEKPRPGNKYKLTYSQHVFPKASIARFANDKGLVSVCDMVRGRTRLASPKDPIFCAARAVSVGVSALKVGASGGQTTATGHSLTVTFVQRGLAELQNAKDRVDAACKYPNAPSQKCKDATEAYNQLRTTGHIGEQIYTTDANRGPIGVEKKTGATK
jgi:hypothetical protein